MITKLGAYNAMLSVKGDKGINSLTDNHPLMGLLDRCFNTALARAIADGTAETEDIIWLYPDQVTGHIVVPEDCDFISAVDNFNSTVIQRGRRLFRRFVNRGEDGFHFNDAIRCHVKLYPSFEDLNISTRLFVQSKAVQEFALANSVSNIKLQQVLTNVQEDYEQMNAAQTRTENANLFESQPTGARLSLANRGMDFKL